MIPEEVVVIAEILAVEFTNKQHNYPDFIDLAWKIYDKVKICQCN